MRTKARAAGLTLVAMMACVALGFAAPGAFAQTFLKITEVDADTAGTDTLEFIELHDGGINNYSLDGFVVVLYNGSDDLSYAAFDLDGYTTDSDGYFVLGNTALAEADLDIGASNIVQNGADAVALYQDDAVNFPNGTPITMTNLIDAIVYDTNDADDAGLLVLINPGQPQVNEDGNSAKDTESNQRCPSGRARDTDTYIQAAPTPGATNDCAPGPALIINEVDADTPGTDTLEFIELFDGGYGFMLLNGYVVVLYNGSDDQSYAAFDLDGHITGPDGYFVLGNTALPETILDIGASNIIQNGPDAVALYQDDAVNFPNDTPITLVNLIDAIVYDTSDADDPGLLALLNAGQPQVNEDGNGAKDTESNQRCPNRSGGARNTDTYAQFPPTPRAHNTCFAVEAHLNEIYASHSGDDDMEMIELVGTPGLSLNGYAVAVVEGEGGGAGTLDRVWDLWWYIMPVDGYFVLGDTAVPTLDYDIGAQDSIENGTETFYLLEVSDHVALLDAVGTDVDTNDDGLIFSTGGELETVATIVDHIGMVDADYGTTDLVYDGAATIGPDGTYFPAGIFRNEDYPGEWCEDSFLDFDDVANADLPRTPGATNGACPTATGACCDRATLTCVDDVLETDCVGANDEFTANTLCADLVPPCEPTGACCYAGYCADDMIQSDCEVGGGVYQGDFTDCSGVDCGAPTEGVEINEIRIDQPGTDYDEYSELYGPAGTSLDGLWYLVIGDGAGGSGVIEAVVPLAGSAIAGDGFFVAAESTFTLGTADLVTDLNFENSDNVTHLLVAGFLGSYGDDLDTNDDGTLDVIPWLAELDRIALVEEDNPPVDTEFHYGPPQIGPDGTYVPGHVERCPDGTGSWSIASFDPLDGEDSPGDPNVCAVCGDGVTEGAEECDDAGESATCDDDCTFVVCGDGTHNATAGEGCDDGNTDPGDGCDENCIVEECGNGVVQTGEDCDDAGESATCDADCTWAVCGDGTTNATAGEDCDDSGESATCDADCTTAYCGDGTTNATALEDCDDAGESVNCDADCTFVECGDNLKNETAGEECDGTDDDFCPGQCQVDCTCPEPPPIIPTVTEWGLVVMVLLGLAAGTIVFARRRVAA